ncbi:MAG TPA: glycine--tRNA ligase [bacterium]|nr:glycine--tRNA ligase [bacterium]
MNKQVTLEKITAWAKRRGFVFRGSDLYGGLANTYDWGPYGIMLKRNIENLWWDRYIDSRDDIHGIDSTILLKSDVWEASGHTESFADAMVEDKISHKRYRADHLLEEHFEKKGKEVKVDGLPLEELTKMLKENKIKSPDGNELTEPKFFNQLFQTEIGIIAGDKNKSYLRGEIAQGLFLNFKNIVDSIHPKLPFGIGQSGKAFRNEITPGKFTFRTLEFDLMEFEYFFDNEKEDSKKFYEYWKKDMDQFANLLGLKKKNIRWRPHEEFERSHYSERTEDLEYEFPWGFKEMWGLAYRTDFDLKNHQEKTGKDLSYSYPDGKKVVPHVIEPSFGLSRTATIVMFDAYTEEEVKGNTRVFMKFDPQIAPIKAAVFPLQKDGKLGKLAKDVYSDLKKSYSVSYDDAGNIGKMYRRQDEIGTPWCITVDYDSLKDKKVTVRDRDTMKQERVEIAKLNSWLKTKLES